MQGRACLCPCCCRGGSGDAQLKRLRTDATGGSGPSQLLALVLRAALGVRAVAALQLQAAGHLAYARQAGSLPPAHSLYSARDES